MLCVYVVSVLLRYLEPNSCPALLADAVAEVVDLVEDDAEFEAAVEKMLGLTVTMSSWPGFTSSITCCAEDNSDGNGFNPSVQAYATALRSDSSLHVAESFFGLQGWTKNSAKCASWTSTRGEASPLTPSRTTTWLCATRHLWLHWTITSLRICSS